MTLKALSRSLDEVAKHLPFAVDDYDRANGAFVHWLETREDEDLKVVDLWLYCYTRRYFLAKFIREPAFESGSLDEPVGEAFQRVRNALLRVEHPERFASYVSVVCKRVYLNFCYRQAQSAHLDLDRAPEPAAPPDTGYDPEGLLAVREAVKAAIERLPESLREVARLRLVDGWTYEDIELAVGRSQSVIRSYLHKAIVRLREDPSLQLLMEELDV